MKELLNKIGLIIKTEITLNIKREEFVELLSNNIDDNNSQPTVFRHSNNTYKGTVLNNNFKLKENHKIFDTSYIDATLSAKILSKKDNTVLQMSSSGLSGTNIAFFCGGLIFLLLLPLMWNSGEDKIGLILGTIIMPIAFMAFPIYLGRSSAMKMLHNFEREIFYMVERRKTITNNGEHP